MLPHCVLASRGREEELIVALFKAVSQMTDSRLQRVILRSVRNSHFSLYIAAMEWAIIVVDLKRSGFAWTGEDVFARSR